MRHSWRRSNASKNLGRNRRFKKGPPLRRVHSAATLIPAPRHAAATAPAIVQAVEARRILVAISPITVGVAAGAAAAPTQRTQLTKAQALILSTASPRRRRRVQRSLQLSNRNPALTKAPNPTITRGQVARAPAAKAHPAMPRIPTVGGGAADVAAETATVHATKTIVDPAAGRQDQQAQVQQTQPLRPRIKSNLKPQSF